MMKIKGT